MATAKKIQQGGFDCEFLEKPPEKFIQSECPVCLQILCEPYQAPCCGKSFCRVCVKRIKTDKKPCPTCKEDNFVTFHNKGLQQALYGFQVYCSHNQEGCEWKGELGHLNNHLNLSPQPDKQLEGCKYSEIECVYCSELIKRSSITAHQNVHCPRRPFSCNYCHSYVSHYEDVIHNHWPVCGYHPVRCPNECGTFPQRQALKNHVTRDCPDAVIDCDFHHVGCDVRLPRKDIQAHIKENLVTHMSLQAASNSKLLVLLQDKVIRLEEENQTKDKTIANMQKTIANLQKTTAYMQETTASMQETTANMQETIITLEQKINDLQITHQTLIPYGTPPYEFVMHNYKEHKENNRSWYSLPFYTHPDGYKLCLRVEANGCGKGENTHMSVFLCIMRGEFDDDLTWPFRGVFSIELVDQDNDKGHYIIKIEFDDETPDEYTSRVTEDYIDGGWGWQECTKHSKLKRKYLQNNCLLFRITKIHLK